MKIKIYAAIIFSLILTGCPASPENNQKQTNVQANQGNSNNLVVEKTTPVTAENSSPNVNFNRGGKTPVTAAENQSDKPNDGDSGITLEKFNKITKGMSYKEVVKILGREGKVERSEIIGGAKTILYRWNASNGTPGAHATALFQDDELIIKNEYELK